MRSWKLASRRDVVAAGKWFGADLVTGLVEVK